MPEIILAFVGLYILIAGRIPVWLIGKPKMSLTGGKARAIGLVFIAPTPVAIGLGMVAGVLFGDRLSRHYTLIELGLVVVALVIGLVLIHKFRSPEEPPTLVQSR
ncbi:MAG TPA: hypothetical protein PKG95_01475 [Anaerolineaceae bacterium]|nr:hypothetical protein [Anaerolineaceae bacterium]